jgi:hypothetical protein
VSPAKAGKAQSGKAATKNEPTARERSAAKPQPRMNWLQENTKITARPTATGAEMDGGVEEWLDLTPALSSRRGRIIGRLTKNPRLLMPNSQPLSDDDR